MLSLIGFILIFVSLAGFCAIFSLKFEGEGSRKINFAAGCITSIIFFVVSIGLFSLGIYLVYL